MKTFNSGLFNNRKEFCAQCYNYVDSMGSNAKMYWPSSQG